MFIEMLLHPKGNQPIEIVKAFRLSKSFTFSFLPLFVWYKSRKLKDSAEPSKLNSNSGG